MVLPMAFTSTSQSSSSSSSTSTSTNNTNSNNSNNNSTATLISPTTNKARKSVSNSFSNSSSASNNNSSSNHHNILLTLRHYYHTLFSYIKSNDNVPFIIATCSVFLFFGIHNYMQELIQYEFHIYQLPLNVMLGYFEVFGVCFFTYLERYMMISMKMNSRSTTTVHHHHQQLPLQNTTMEEGHSRSVISNSSNSNMDQDNKISNHNDHSIVLHNHNHRKAPLSVYPFLTLCLLSSSALSNLSLNYINFPTKVVFRSCKLLPTMVIATLLHPNKKKFTMIEYICATIVCLGLICFGMAEFQTQPTFHPIGILFVSLSVFADALLPNAQERVFVQYHAPRSEVTFYTNLFTLMIMTITTYASGDLMNCFHFMYEHSKITIYIFIYTVISYIAISCHMNVVQMYGGVAAVLVATGRKAMTLIVSFLLFPKVYTIYYPIGTILVLSGLTWASLSKVYSKNGNNGKKSKKAMNTDSVVVPLLSTMKSHRSDIMNDDDGNENDHRNNHNATTIPHDGR